MPEKFDHEQFEAPVTEARIPAAEARIAVSTMAAEPSASATEPTAVQSSDVAADPELPALVELEAFLVAIERARRDVAYHAAR
jgi:hypothetical protein